MLDVRPAEYFVKVLLRALGHSAKEIAAALCISPKSVETYYTRIREKWKLRTRAEMVRYALENGILSSKRLS